MAYVPPHLRNKGTGEAVSEACWKHDMQAQKLAEKSPGVSVRPAAR